MLEARQGSVQRVEGKALRLLAVQMLLTALLLGGVPVAASMVPYERIYTDGHWRAPHDLDPLWPLRVGLVAVGLIVPLLCAVLVHRTRRAEGVAPGQVALQTALLVAAFVVGWRNYPYWATGVYAAYQGRAPISDFDPGGLLPESTWMGPLWGLGVLLLCPGAVAVFALLLARLARERLRVQLRFVLGVVACLGVTAWAFFSTPQYMDWFMD